MPQACEQCFEVGKLSAHLTDKTLTPNTPRLMSLSLTHTHTLTHTMPRPMGVFSSEATFLAIQISVGSASIAFVQV